MDSFDDQWPRSGWLGALAATRALGPGDLVVEPIDFASRAGAMTAVLCGAVEGVAACPDSTCATAGLCAGPAEVVAWTDEPVWLELDECVLLE